MKDVRLIGPTIDYRDGAEQRVLDTLDMVGDLSSGSDELAAHITDWPTKYHFSPQRANLLRPLRFGPAMRVLDVGAGTGTLARHVAETGAQVFALEGGRARAEAAARRCRDLANVEVVCGSLTDFEDDGGGFDVVLCVGVLEHTAPAHHATLAHLRRLTRPRGVLALAIENQLGLRYLLGYEEDHLLEPWRGVEGYPGVSHVRTFSRDRLRHMLGDAGFRDQRWLFPFPDYKLPRVVLAEAAYEGRHGARFVDQLVRWPCSGEASPASRLCDDRLAHAVFLDAGLGPDVANSFLVIAGDAPDGIHDLVDPGVMAWLAPGERRRAWRTSKTFRRDEGGTGEVRAAPDLRSDAGRPSGWLRQQRPPHQPLHVGPTLEQRFLEACCEGREPAEGVLRRWREHLRGFESQATEDAGPVDAHPFCPQGSRTLLPADHLDVNLSNFVDTDEGLIDVDREWSAPSGVAADIVVLRALWGLAADMVRRGIFHPWAADLTVDELAQSLGTVAGLRAGTPELEEWRRAEADLLATVQGGSAEDHLEWLTRTGALSQSSTLVRALPFTALRREVAASTHRLVTVKGRLAMSHAAEEELRRQLADARGQLAVSAEALAAARSEVGSLSERLDAAVDARTAAEEQAASSTRRADAERDRGVELAACVNSLSRRWGRLERRLPVRFYRALLSRART